MTKNYVLKPIYNDENECVHDTLSEMLITIWLKQIFFEFDFFY